MRCPDTEKDHLVSALCSRPLIIIMPEELHLSRMYVSAQDPEVFYSVCNPTRNTFFDWAFFGLANDLIMVTASKIRFQGYNCKMMTPG